MTEVTTRQTPVRWGLLGASRIAVREFLPALRHEGGGRAEVVGARDRARAERFAAQHGIARSVGGYRAVVEAPDVDAIYVALPNDLHTRWAAAAARAGKAVLCEKPLGLDEADVSGLVAVVGSGALIWEAMVFPFHPQTDLLQSLVASELGGITRIESDFSFELDNAADFRWDQVHGGGALYDIGCYCIRLARSRRRLRRAGRHWRRSVYGCRAAPSRRRHLPLLVQLRPAVPVGCHDHRAGRIDHRHEPIPPRRL
jgi:predicted dehydrogenase